MLETADVKVADDQVQALIIIGGAFIAIFYIDLAVYIVLYYEIYIYIYNIRKYICMICMPFPVLFFVVLCPLLHDL